MTQEKPKFPYVEFKRMKSIWNEQTKSREEVASVCFVRVSGCHGSPEAMLQFEKDGMVIVGYGNLDQQKYNQLKHYCDSRLGTKLHPSLKAALETHEVMNAKIERARSTKTA